VSPAGNHRGEVIDMVFASRGLGLIKRSTSAAVSEDTRRPWLHASVSTCSTVSLVPVGQSPHTCGLVLALACDPFIEPGLFPADSI
jgi:hypothetical protein